MSKPVIVYSTPFCPPCESLKAFLAANGVAFQTVDLLIDEDAAERLEDLGIRSAPALEVDGTVYAGNDLNPDRVRGLLGL